MGALSVRGAAMVLAALGVVAGACSGGEGASSGTHPAPGGGGGGATSSGAGNGGGGGSDAGGGGGGDAAGGRDATLGPPDARAGDGGAPFTFLVYGDSRADGSDCSANAAHARLVGRMTGEQAAFVVHVGDMITGYAKGTCFTSNGDCSAPGSIGNVKEIIAPLLARAPSPGLPVFFFPTVGNHDDNTGDGWYPDPCSGAHICDVFDLKKVVTDAADPCGGDYPARAYYSFRYGGALFVVLHVNNDDFSFFTCNGAPAGYSGCDDYCKNGPRDARRADSCYEVHQYDWLVSKLAAADKDPTIAHKLVFLHAPVYTSFADHPPVAAAPQLRDLYDAYRVTAQFNAHNHTYERTHPIRGGAKAASGTIFVTTSGGGVSMDAPSGDWFTAASASSNHYVRVHVGAEVHGEAVGADGAVLDAF